MTEGSKPIEPQKAQRTQRTQWRTPNEMLLGVFAYPFLLCALCVLCAFCGSPRFRFSRSVIVADRSSTDADGPAGDLFDSGGYANRLRHRGRGGGDGPRLGD